MCLILSSIPAQKDTYALFRSTLAITFMKIIKLYQSPSRQLRGSQGAGSQCRVSCSTVLPQLVWNFAGVAIITVWNVFKDDFYPHQVTCVSHTAVLNLLSFKVIQIHTSRGKKLICRNTYTYINIKEKCHLVDAVEHLHSIFGSVKASAIYYVLLYCSHYKTLFRQRLFL